MVSPRWLAAVVLLALPSSAAIAQDERAPLCDLPWTVLATPRSRGGTARCEIVSSLGYTIAAHESYRGWPSRPVEDLFDCGPATSRSRAGEARRVVEVSCSPTSFIWLLEHPDGLVLRADVSTATPEASIQAREVLRSLRPHSATDRTGPREIGLPGYVGTVHLPPDAVAEPRATPHGEGLALHPMTGLGDEPTAEVYFTTDLGAPPGPGDECWAPLGSRTFRGTLRPEDGGFACAVEVAVDLGGERSPVAFGWWGLHPEAPAWALALLRSVEPEARVAGDEQKTGWQGVAALVMGLCATVALAGWIAWRWRTPKT